MCFGKFGAPKAIYEQRNASRTPQKYHEWILWKNTGK